MRSVVVDSPIGPLTLVADDDALRRVHFPQARPRPDDGAEPVAGRARHRVLTVAARQLEEYFTGERRDFELPLHPVGTVFQLAAWQALTAIPYASTVTYAEQARRLGDVRKARAVGSANGQNPLAIVVPCHRVIGANGALTGFGGGLATKAWLLEHEQRIVGARLPI